MELNCRGSFDAVGSVMGDLRAVGQVVVKWVV